MKDATDQNAHSSSQDVGSRLFDAFRALDALGAAIQADKVQLEQTVRTPLQLMQLRAEKAEEALKVSELAKRALATLQNNSVEVIKKGEAAILLLKGIVHENDEESLAKEKTIADLKDIVEKNAANLQASALALSAVNELAYYDLLTGLPNRRLLSDRLKQIILNNKRNKTYSAAIFLDLDKFKRLNDEFGHEAGDNLLAAIANRLKACVRETDTVARYGGDEFVVLLNKLHGNFDDARVEAKAVSEKILAALTPSYSLRVRCIDGAVKTIEHQNYASLGVAMFDGLGAEENQVLDWADEAMYWAKSEGGNTIRFYDAAHSATPCIQRNP